MQYSIPEKRTYKCLKKDTSVSLTNLEPVHLTDSSYWQLLYYSIGDQFYLKKKHLSLIPDKSVTTGTYECIEEDYDIDTNTATLSNENVPLCFTRAIGITLSDGVTKYTVYPWTLKWEKIGELPSHVE